MIKIRSKAKVLVENREQISDFVAIEITSFTYNTGSGFTVNIRDFIDSDVSNTEPMGMMGNNLKTKTLNYTIDRINQMAGVIGATDTEFEATYTADLDLLLSKALLLITQTELNADGKTIYGLLPEQWEIVAN